MHPPLVKAWRSGDNRYYESVLQVGKDLVAYGTSQYFGVVNIATNQTIWSKHIATSEYDTRLSYDGKYLYVLTGKGSLSACDPKTGAVAWSLPASAYPAKPILENNRMWVSLEAGTISAVDIRQHRIRWTTNLLAETEEARRLALQWEPTLIPEMHGNVIVAAHDSQIAACNAQTGHILWRKPLDVENDKSQVYRITSLISDEHRVYGLQSDGIFAYDLHHGTPLWRFRRENTWNDKFAARIGNLLVVVGFDGHLYALDCRSGRQVWSRSFVPDAKSFKGGSTALVISVVSRNGEVLVVDPLNVRRIDLHSGTVRWSWSLDQDPISPSACLSCGQRLVIASQDLWCFQPGQPIFIPKDHGSRQSLAQRLAADFAAKASDEDIRRSLVKLGDKAFDALLPYIRSDSFAASAPNAFSDFYDHFSKIVAAAEMVMRFQRTEETDAIVALVMQDKIANAQEGGVRGLLLGLIASKGDTNRAVLPMLRSGELLRHSNEIGADPIDEANSALHGLSDSNDPRAGHFLAALLLDPQVAPTVKAKVFSCAGRSGNKEAIAAILALRAQANSPLPSFRNLMNLDTLSQTPTKEGRIDSAVLLALHAEPSGVVWGLIASGVLGSVGDLWVVPRNADGKWGDPIFTGVDSLPERNLKSPQEPVPFKYHGMTLRTFIDSGVWFNVFVDKPELTRDSDGDGWSDLVEKRLGTDPHRADTDGDGVIDSASNNPLSGRTPSSDAENVLAAAFDARMRLMTSTGPLIVYLPKGMKPFALTGAGGIVIAAESEAATPLRKLYEKGVGLVRFAPIEWNASDTEATVGLSLAYGGLSVTGYEIHVRKIAGHWIVVESTLVMVA